jgi:hypothetical protein
MHLILFLIQFYQIVNMGYLLFGVGIEAHTTEESELIFGEHLSFYPRLYHSLLGDDFPLEEWCYVQSTLRLNAHQHRKACCDNHQYSFHFS